MVLALRAVMSAVWVGAEDETETGKLVAICPPGMVTDAGTVTPVAVVETYTITPPLGAKPVRYIEHEPAAPAVRLYAHENLESSAVAVVVAFAVT